MANKIESVASIFYDAGNGRSEDARKKEIIYFADSSWSTISVKYSLLDLPESAWQSPLYFDPCEGHLVRIKDFKIFCDGKLLSDSSYKAINSDQNLSNKWMYFLTCDPIYELYLKKCKTLEIEYEIEPLSTYEISSLFDYKNQIIWAVDGLKHQIKKKVKGTKIQLPVYDDIRYLNKEHAFTAEKTIEHIDYKDNHKKVLFVVHSGEKHGPVFLIKNFIATAKIKFGIDPIILVLTQNIIRNDFKKLGFVLDLDINYFDINLRKNVLDGFLKKVFACECNIALCNDLTTGIVADSLKENGFKVTQLVHELPELVNFNNLSNSAEISFNNSDNFVFSSNYMLNRFVEEGIYKKGKKYIAPQALYNVDFDKDYSCKQKAKSSLANELGISSDSKIVLGCGTGFLVKGIDLFVDTAIDILKDFPNVYFVWIGHFSNPFDNMGRVLAERQISIFNRENNIHLFDFVENPANYFAAADVYFCSSRNDAFPSTLLEAQASYTPAVVFNDSGGSPELIKSGYNGEVVEYGNTKDAAVAIKRILEDDAYRKQLSLNAHESVKDYTMENYVAKILKICGIV